MIIAYYACFQLGAIAAPLRTAFTTAELDGLLQRLTPTIYLGELNLYHNVAAIDAAVLSQHKRFVVGAGSDHIDPQPWETLFDGQDSSQLSTAPDIHEPAVVINTSGTTGQPKIVAHSAATLAESVELGARYFGMSAKDVIVHPLPLAHAGGLGLFLAYIYLGAPFILIESFDPETVLDAFQRYGCTFYFGFPAQYAQMLISQRAHPRDLSSLRLCVTFGDVCPVELQEQVYSTFKAPVYNVWGASEVMGSLMPGLKWGPVSRVVNATQIRLVDETGAEVPSGEVGELLVRGANVFCGYWNDVPSTEQSLTSGWYHTGDLMRRGEGDEMVRGPEKRYHHTRRDEHFADRGGRSTRCFASRRQGSGSRRRTGCRPRSTHFWLCHAGGQRGGNGCSGNPGKRRRTIGSLQDSGRSQGPG
jgi:acyl-CoA synthetase (AMP-forming)/AMP-acid ligase II